jgi:DNA-3-methyladenine glycosylase I
MMLDSFQAGLSWRIILHKRENFRKAFDTFDVTEIAQYDESKIQELMQDASIVRNQAKIRATVNNAKAFLLIQEEFGTFDNYIWQFTNHKTIMNQPTINSEIACRSTESDAMSKDLIQRGFKFVGSTICYSFMQAAGIVNDHLAGCEFK